MKNPFIYFLCLGLACCQNLKASDTKQPLRSMAVLLDEYNLGAWALKQHNEICRRIYPAVSAGKLKAYNTGHILITKEEAVKLLQMEVAGFIMISPDDPTIGRDSMMYEPLLENYSAFELRGKQVLVTPQKGGKSLAFDQQDFLQMLTPENLVYFLHYTRNNQVTWSMIPAISESLMTGVNTRLYNNSLDRHAEVFISDSLVTKYSAAQLEARSKAEIIQFIPSPDVPDDGYDTIYSQSIIPGDTSHTQGVFFALHSKGLDIKISGISSVFHPTISGVVFDISIPFGFMSYKKAVGLIGREKNMLEYALAFTVKDKLDPQALYHYNDYIKTFGLTGPKG